MEGDDSSLIQCEELLVSDLGREQGMIAKNRIYPFWKKYPRDKAEAGKLLNDPLILKIRKKSVVPRNLGQRRFRSST